MKRERLTLIRTYKELRNRGYGGGYDAAWHHASSWSRATQEALANVPKDLNSIMRYQSDWIHSIGFYRLAKFATILARFQLLREVR